MLPLFIGMLADKYVNMKLLYCKHLPDWICVLTKYLLFCCRCICCIESKHKF